MHEVPMLCKYFLSLYVDCGNKAHCACTCNLNSFLASFPPYQLQQPNVNREHTTCAAQAVAQKIILRVWSGAFLSHKVCSLSLT